MKHNLRFGTHTYELEEFKFHLWIKESGVSDWTFEIYPPGTDNYIMINSIDLGGIIEVPQFAGQKFSISEELEGHTTYVDGILRFLKTLNLNFGPYSQSTGKISMSGMGKIAAGDGARQPEIDYEFNGEASWAGIVAFGTKEATCFEPIFKAYNRTVDQFDIVYKTSHDDFSCSALPRWH